MKLFLYSALAATLCAAPAMAQPQEGANMFPVQPADGQQPKPRPAEVNLQIKEDMQALANTLNNPSNFIEGESYVFDARIGFFGSSEWKRALTGQLSGNSVEISDVKIIARDGDTTKAAVTYSFKLSPYFQEPAPEFWQGAHQETLNFRLGHKVFGAEQIVWQIVPPEKEPLAFNPSDAEEQDNLFDNVAYHLAQKKVLEITGTPAEISTGNLKQLGLGVAQLVQDYNEVYAFDSRYLIESITPYVFNPRVVQVPNTNEIYTFNANLSGLNLAKVNEVYQTVLFYEGQNETPTFRYDGKAAICFADGHVALVTPDQAKSLIWKP